MKVTNLIRKYRNTPAVDAIDKGNFYTVEVFIDEDKLRSMLKKSIRNSSKECRDGALIVKAHLEKRI